MTIKIDLEKAFGLSFLASYHGHSGRHVIPTKLGKKYYGMHGNIELVNYLKWKETREPRGLRQGIQYHRMFSFCAWRAWDS